MTAREPSPSVSSFRLIIVGLIGNVMEWYDFAVYGFFAATLGRLFFPAEQPGVSLIASFGAFAAGFLVRPLGGARLRAHRRPGGAPAGDAALGG